MRRRVRRWLDGYEWDVTPSLVRLGWWYDVLLAVGVVVVLVRSRGQVGPGW